MHDVKMKDLTIRKVDEEEKDQNMGVWWGDFFIFAKKKAPKGIAM